jgi:hypothetical protein
MFTYHIGLDNDVRVQLLVLLNMKDFQQDTAVPQLCCPYRK